MRAMHFGKIIRIHPESLAEELGLSVGDRVLEVNGQRLRDIIDLSFSFADCITQKTYPK